MKNPILLVGAMEKELSGIIDYYKCQPLATLQQTYPLYQAKNAPLFVLHTHVGDTNAAIATTLALKEINPQLALKIGCVGGNSAGIHTSDYILPITYFHSGSWITRSRRGNKPTSDAAKWQSVFGTLPYQVNTENLGGKPTFFPADQNLNQRIDEFYSQKKLPHSTAYLGGGNMWFFDLSFMKQVLKTQIPGSRITNRWVADMESYAIALACHIHQIPFTGIYRVSNSDYYAEPYIPENVAQYFNQDFARSLEGLITTL